MKQHLLNLVSHVSMSTAILYSELNEVFGSIYGKVMLVVNTCCYQGLLLPRMVLALLVRVQGAGDWDMVLNCHAWRIHLWVQFLHHCTNCTKFWLFRKCCCWRWFHGQNGWMGWYQLYCCHASKCGYILPSISRQNGYRLPSNNGFASPCYTSKHCEAFVGCAMSWLHVAKGTRIGLQCQIRRLWFQPKSYEKESLHCGHTKIWSTHTVDSLRYCKWIL